MPVATPSAMNTFSSGSDDKVVAPSFPLLAALRSRYFLKNVLAVIGAAIALFFLVNVGLRLYTNHGNSVQVEDYVGLTIEAATKKARARGFRVDINEAPFDLAITKGEVIDQEPASLSRIKRNRPIYLTVVGQPREVSIPTFEDAADDFGRYRQKLRPLQVKTAVREAVFDAKLADSTILHFYYQGKKYSPSDVKRGVKIMQGSTLEFVVSKSNDDLVATPNLICKRFSEVSFLLSSLDLALGDVEGNEGDGYIWKQEPAYVPGSRIERGTKIKVYVQASMPSHCNPEEETNDPPSDSGGLEEDPFEEEGDDF